MIIRFLMKLALVPLWLILLVLWIPVHATVFICGMFHGLGKLFFGFFTVLAICFGMWQNAAIFLVCIALTFALVFAGAVVDALLQIAREFVGRWIIA